MDRDRTQSAIDRGTMRVGWVGALDVLLRAGGRERRESQVDAGNRRALPQAAVLRLAADDRLAFRAGVGGQREACGAVDAGDGVGGKCSGAAHQPQASRAPGLPVFTAGSQSPATQSGVVLGHHLRADAAGISVSGGGNGLVQSIRAGLGVVQHVGGFVLRRGAHAGAGDRLPGDLQHRPGGAVYQREVYRDTPGCRNTDQHGRPGSGAGQRDGGAVVAQCEVRGDLFVELSRWDRGLAGIESVLPLLQHRATTSGIGKQNAGTGLLRVKTGGTWDMASGQIVAYKRSWSESLKSRGAQTVKTTTWPLSLHSRIRKRNNKERRFHDLGSIAYLRSKTVQPMGGSSVYSKYAVTILDWTQDKAGVVAVISTPEIVLADLVYLIGVLSLASEKLEPLGILMKTKIDDSRERDVAPYEFLHYNNIFFCRALSGYSNKVHDHIREVLKSFEWLPELVPSIEGKVEDLQHQTNLLLSVWMSLKGNRMWPDFARFYARRVMPFVKKIKHDESFRKKIAVLVDIKEAEVRNGFMEKVGEYRKRGLGGDYWWDSIGPDAFLTEEERSKGGAQ